MTTDIDPKALRSWLFIDGADEAALAAGPASEADVLIQELEDFTPPEMRPRAREISPDVLAAWKAAGAVTAVRVNPLDGDGMADLTAIMRGAPDIVMLPKTAAPRHIVELAAAIARCEADYDLEIGSTGIVPNIEQAAGLLQTFAICGASDRVVACGVASEDMAADLGAERGRDGIELAYVRERFHVECVAAGSVSLDCPYTWTDLEGVTAETQHARRLGYTGKLAVHHAHPPVINRLLTPSDTEVVEAGRIVAAFEAARVAGKARAELDGSLIEVPIYLTAKRLLDRAALFSIPHN
ncbi:MAG: CoA ester lyase [Rhodospirillaceae bacterium]|nr:CoA ester lyase [Rhodospirillaceae bacterium]